MSVLEAECKMVSFGDRILNYPKPDSFDTYYPSVEPALRTYPGVVEALKDLGGRHLVAAIGYGSSFNGESIDSLLDFIIIVDDIKEFHEDNRKRRPKDYDPVLGNPAIQTWANHFSINLYPSSLEIDGKPKPIKYGVVGLEDFLVQARSGMKERGGVSHLYTAGRLQKAMLMSFVVSEDPNIRQSIDLAINQARIDGIWSTLGLLPENFAYDELIKTYTAISYMADKRIEKPNKPQILVDQSKDEYAAMMKDLLGAFEREHILETIGPGQFRKKVSLSEREVRSWLSESAWYSFRVNYFKNAFITYGPVRGLLYAKAKVKRATAPAEEQVWQKTPQEEYNLEALGSDISAILLRHEGESFSNLLIRIPRDGKRLMQKIKRTRE